MYHDFLENRKKTTSGQETNIQQVWLLLLYCETIALNFWNFIDFHLPFLSFGIHLFP